MRGCFAEHRLMGGRFAENRHVVFFWKLPGKGACGVLPEQMLERTRDVREGYNYNPMAEDHTVWHSFTLPRFAGVPGICSHCAENVLALALLAFFTERCLSLLCKEKHNKELLVVFQGLLVTSLDSSLP